MYLTLPWASVLKGMQFLNTVIDAEKSKKVQLYTLQLFLDSFNKIDLETYIILTDIYSCEEIKWSLTLFGRLV